MIATGSPGGSAVSEDEPRWLRAGQDVEVEVEGVGGAEEYGGGGIAPLRSRILDFLRETADFQNALRPWRGGSSGHDLVPSRFSWKRSAWPDRCAPLDTALRAYSG